MKYVLGLLLAGCATPPTTGQCVEYYALYEYGEPVGVQKSGGTVYYIEQIKQGRRRASCY